MLDRRCAASFDVMPNIGRLDRVALRRWANIICAHREGTWLGLKLAACLLAAPTCAHLLRHLPFRPLCYYRGKAGFVPLAHGLVDSDVSSADRKARPTR